MWNILAIGTIAGALALSALNAHAQSVNRKATLTWTAPTTCDGGTALTNCPITGYAIQRQSGTVWNDIGVTAANVLTFTEQNLAPGTYTYRVLANSAAGPSPPSASASKSFVVPGAPTNLVITVTITIEP